MDDRGLIASAQQLLRDFQDPERLAALGQSLETVAGLLQRQEALTAEIGRIGRELARAEAESRSRLAEYRQQEEAAQQRHAEANAARQRDAATLDQTREQLKVEVAALYDERRGVRESIEQARADQITALAGLAHERREAERALAQAREALAKLRETIPT